MCILFTCSFPKEKFLNRPSHNRQWALPSLSLTTHEYGSASWLFQSEMIIIIHHLTHLTEAVLCHGLLARKALDSVVSAQVHAEGVAILGHPSADGTFYDLGAVNALDVSACVTFVLEHALAKSALDTVIVENGDQSPGDKF
jgi:hypothetical protein